MWHRAKRGKWLSFFLLACTVSMGGLWLSAPVAAVGSQIESNICDDFLAPTITEPVPTTTDSSSITVAGSGEPDMTVALRNNGVTSGTVLIADDGSYSLQIPLEVGDNVLVARTANGCGAKDSASVTVHRNAPPQPPQPAPIPSGAEPTAPSAVGGAPSSPPVQSPSGEPTARPPLGEAIPSPIPQPTPGFMPPTITEPSEGEVFSTQRIWVAGKAVPFSIITVYANGIAVATVTADENGSFGVSIQLPADENTLQVRAGLGKNVAFSKSITVQVVSPAESRMSWFVLSLMGLLLLGLLIILIVLLATHRKHRKKQRKQNA